LVMRCARQEFQPTTPTHRFAASIRPAVAGRLRRRVQKPRARHTHIELTLSTAKSWPGQTPPRPSRRISPRGRAAGDTEQKK
jgi:hypothetical protein